MPTDFRHIRFDVVTFLSAVRHAVDRPSLRIVRDDRTLYVQTMLLIEEARIRFNSIFRSASEPSERELYEAKREIIQFIDEFIELQGTNNKIFERSFRAPVLQRDRLTSFMTNLLTSGSDLGEAMIIFRNYIEESTISPPDQIKIKFEDLNSIVPTQQIAPAKFDIIDGRISLSHGTPRRMEEDKSNIDAALTQIKESGRLIIDQLKSSNCDRRLVDTFKVLNDKISNDENIIQIGMMNISCGIMTEQFHEEIPDAVCAMLKAYNVNVSMYAAQFPDWEQFTQRAASVELSDQDVSEIYHTAGDLISQLELQPELTDPQVPETLKFVRELMANPGKSATRAAFAMMRTIENLISSIVRHTVTLAEQTATNTVETLSRTGAKVIAALLSVALVGATGIGTTAAQIGAPWVKQVAEIVQKKIEAITSA